MQTIMLNIERHLDVGHWSNLSNQPAGFQSKTRIT